MRLVLAAAVAAALFVVPCAARAAQNAPAPTEPAQQPPAQPAAQEPAAQQPAPATQQPAPAVQQPAPGQPAQPQPPPAGTPPARAFTANAGLLFNTVKPDRTADFEKVIADLQMALEKSGDATVQAQARGWRVFRASEPGPNNTVLYVFVLDPAVPGADYGLGHILGQAFTDPAELQEIWKLYTGAVTGGGTLLNLTPVGAGAAPAPAAPPPFALPETQPKMLPPDADPNRR